MSEKKDKREGGAIIIEATIALTTFMFAIISILFVSHICYAQAKIGTVIDGVSKDLSEFSYIYSITGLADKQSKLSSEASQAQKGIDDVMDNLDSLADTVSNLKTVGSSLVNDSEMQSSMLALIKNEAANKAESLATSLLVKQFAKSRLSGTSSDCETVLKNLGVQKTAGSYLDSIDFGDSVFCVNGSAEIKVVARYSVKLITLLNVDITYDICQCAPTKAWGAAHKPNEEVAKEADETSDPDETTSEPEETDEPEEPEKTPDDIAKECTKNPGSDKVMLGAGSQLLSDADYIGATYFVMNEDYNGLYDKWEIQKKFLEQNKGKTFYVNTDPDKVTDSYLKKQIIWLQDQGYTFKKNALGYWEAVK